VTTELNIRIIGISAHDQRQIRARYRAHHAARAGVFSRARFAASAHG
jgi:hypothetical protein